VAQGEGPEFKLQDRKKKKEHVLLDKTAARGLPIKLCIKTDEKKKPFNKKRIQSKCKLSQPSGKFKSK
jgi:hypothetical protein